MNPPQEVSETDDMHTIELMEIPSPSSNRPSSSPPLTGPNPDIVRGWTTQELFAYLDSVIVVE